MTRPDGLPNVITRRHFLKTVTAAGLGLGLTGCGDATPAGGFVRMYNFDTYIGTNTLTDFKKATGIEVKLDLFTDHDAMFAKLRGGNPGYDLIVPSNDFVERLITAKLLLPLDRARIPNFKNIDPLFQEARFDPERRYSMPYVWGTAGIGYRKSKVEGVPDSWKWLLDSDRYTKRIALLGEGPRVIQMALKYLGHSINTRDAAHIGQAEALLRKQKPHVKVFADDNGQDLLAARDVDLCMEWNGDVNQLMGKDPDIGFVTPREGTLIYEDCLSIPVGARNPDGAHVLINYILDAEAGAHIARTIQYATPNAAAKLKLGPDYTGNPAIFPSDKILESSEVASYPGPQVTRLYDEAWTRIKAG